MNVLRVLLLLLPGLASLAIEVREALRGSEVRDPGEQDPAAVLAVSLGYVLAVSILVLLGAGWGVWRLAW